MATYAVYEEFGDKSANSVFSFEQVRLAVECVYYDDQNGTWLCLAKAASLLLKEIDAEPRSGQEHCNQVDAEGVAEVRAKYYYDCSDLLLEFGWWLAPHSKGGGGAAKVVAFPHYNFKRSSCRRNAPIVANFFLRFDVTWKRVATSPLEPPAILPRKLRNWKKMSNLNRTEFLPPPQVTFAKHVRF